MSLPPPSGAPQSLPLFVFTPEQTSSLYSLAFKSWSSQLTALEAESQLRISVIQREYADKKERLDEESRIRKECMEKEGVVKREAIITESKRSYESEKNRSQQETKDMSDLKKDELKTNRLKRECLENEAFARMKKLPPNGKWMEDSR